MLYIFGLLGLASAFFHLYLQSFSPFIFRGFILLLIRQGWWCKKEKNTKDFLSFCGMRKGNNWKGRSELISKRGTWTFIIASWSRNLLRNCGPQHKLYFYWKIFTVSSHFPQCSKFRFFSGNSNFDLNLFNLYFHLRKKYLFWNLVIFDRDRPVDRSAPEGRTSKNHNFG